MKRFIAVAAAILTAAILSTAPASAQQASFQRSSNSLYFFGNVCDNLQCLNNVLGGTANGNPIQWWHWGDTGEPNNDWNVWLEGTVSCAGNSFPFYSFNKELLSVCSSYWQGKMVFKLAFAPNGNGSGKCIDAGAANPSYPSVRAQLYTCSSGTSPAQTQLFIYSSSNWLVNVFATNVSYGVQDNNTYWLGTCPGVTTQDTEPACITSVDPVAFTLRSKGI